MDYDSESQSSLDNDLSLDSSSYNSNRASKGDNIRQSREKKESEVENHEVKFGSRLSNNQKPAEDTSSQLIHNFKGFFNRSASIRVKNYNPSNRIEEIKTHHETMNGKKDKEDTNEKANVNSNVNDSENNKINSSLSRISRYSSPSLNSFRASQIVNKDSKENNEIIRLNNREEEESEIENLSISETPRTSHLDKDSQFEDRCTVNIRNTDNVNKFNNFEKNIQNSENNNKIHQNELNKKRVNDGRNSIHNLISANVNTEKTVINNNYNINISLSDRNNNDSFTEEIKRRISLKMRNKNTSVPKITINTENDTKTEENIIHSKEDLIDGEINRNRRCSGLVKRNNIKNLIKSIDEENQKKNNISSLKLNNTQQTSSLSVGSPVKVTNSSPNSSLQNSKVVDLKERIKRSIIDKLMEDEPKEEIINTNRQEEEFNASAEESEEDLDSIEDEFDENKYADSEEEDYESEENDEIVEFNEEDLENGSFLKEMLMETNRQYIKDKQTNEDKIMRASALTIFDILALKIKMSNLYSFLKIQSFNKIKIRNYKISLTNCFKIFSFRRKELLRTYIKRFKATVEKQKMDEKSQFMSKLQGMIKEIGVESEIEKFAKNEDLIKSVYEKINEYMIKNKLIKEEIMNNNNNKDSGLIKEEPKKETEMKAEASKAPEVPKINIPPVPGSIPKVPGNTPSVPSVPGVPNIPSIPGVPKVPSVPGVPNIPSVPGVPKVPGVPGIPGVPNIPSVPGVPGVPSKPGVTGVPGIPGLPKVPGLPNAPIIPNPNLIPTQPAMVQPKPPKDTNPKKIFWNVLPKNKLPQTFWAKEKLDAKVDYDFLCKFFCEPKKKEETKKAKEEEAKKTDSNNALIKILDDKRLMNLGIALSKVTLSNDDLKKAIENFEEDKLNLEMIEKICALAPNSEEIEKLKGFTGDVNQISHGERFCLTLISIYKFMNKLECLKYKKMIEIEKEEIVSKLKILREGMISIKGSPSFLSVLKIILMAGNYLNADTAKGNAIGVSINTLPMLETVKGIGKEKYTLMDFLVINIRSKEPSLVNFYKDFSNLQEILQIDIADVETKIKEFENGLKKIKKEKETLEKENKEEEKPFFDFLRNLELIACDKFDEILSLQESMNKEFNEAAIFFGEDPKQFKPGDFFKIINDFVENFKRISNKLSAEEAKQLKKQIREDKNKKEDTKKKYTKDLEKIRKTVVRKTVARKTAMKMNFNKEKLKELIKNEEISPNSSPSFVINHERNSDKCEKDKILDKLGKVETVASISKSPLTSSRGKNLNINMIPEVIKENKTRETKVRITKARITKFKNKNNNDSGSDEYDTEIDNDFLMINQPLKINKLSINMNQASKNLLSTINESKPKDKTPKRRVNFNQ